MSQADSPNTTSPSRRTVLAGLSVATASVAAVDILLAARVPGDDPILAEIRREQNAADASRAAHAAFTQLEDQVPDDIILHEEAAYLDVGSFEGKRLSCRTSHDFDMAFGLMGVERQVPLDSKSPEMAALRAEYWKARPQFDEMTAQRDRGKSWRAEHRYDEVEAAARAATDAWWDAQKVLLQTQPTSVPGLLALLDHLNGIDQDEWADDWAELVFPTIAESVRSLMA
jgi:hypothetical protein